MIWWIVVALFSSQNWSPKDWSTFADRSASQQFLGSCETSCSLDTALSDIHLQSRIQWEGMQHLIELPPEEAYFRYKGMSELCIGPSKHCRCLIRHKQRTKIRNAKILKYCEYCVASGGDDTLFLKLDPRRATQFLPKDARRFLEQEIAWESVSKTAMATRQLPTQFGSLVLWMENPPAFATIKTEEFDSPYWMLQVWLHEAKALVLSIGSEPAKHNASYTSFVNEYLKHGSDQKVKDSLRVLENRFRRRAPKRTATLANPITRKQQGSTP